MAVVSGCLAPASASVADIAKIIARRGKDDPLRVLSYSEIAAMDSEPA
jgi:hypothetical protein